MEETWEAPSQRSKELLYEDATAADQELQFQPRFARLNNPSSLSRSAPW